MTFAAINYLTISINVLLVVFVFICVLMTFVILMQRPKQEGLGAAFGAGVTDQVFGARTTNVLQRGTVYLGSAFFLLSLTLAILIGQQNAQKSLLGKRNAPKTEAAAPVVPVAPKSISEELSEPVETPVTPATPEIEVPAPDSEPTELPAPEVVPAPEVTPTPETAPEVETPAPAEPAPSGSTEKTEEQ